jgi:DNA damage-inducible protein 1
MRLIDTRFASTASGVGTARILGKVHAVQIQIGSANFECSFTILEAQNMDFLLGLDVLKRYAACINLKDNVLEIGGERIPFLTEGALPSDAFGGKENPKVTRDKAAQAASASSSSSSSAASSSSSSSTSSSSSPAPPAATADTAMSSAPAPAPASPAVTSTPSSMSSVPSSVAAPAAAAAAPAAAAVAAPAAPAAVAGAVGGGVSEAAIAAVMGLGFDRARAQQALEMFGGNAEMAASFLFGGSN